MIDFNPVGKRGTVNGGVWKGKVFRESWNGRRWRERCRCEESRLSGRRKIIKLQLL
jgi:hypothetical protein